MVPTTPVNEAAEADARRLALGEFLRSHRERLDPKRFGFTTAGRRRTPGLRREEVATRAGVGVVWYTWLEQGREIHPSRESLAFIADALELQPPEREHLFTLAGQPLLDRPVLATEGDVPGSTQALLRALDPNPAYVTNARRDLLAWNAMADRVYGISRRVPEDRNTLVMFFLDPTSRERFDDWESMGAQMVATFRLSAAPFTGQAPFTALLARLAGSQEFTRLWNRVEVDARRSGIKTLHHADLGTLRFEHQALQPVQAPGLTLVVYTPAE